VAMRGLTKERPRYFPKCSLVEDRIPRSGLRRTYSVEVGLRTSEQGALCLLWKRPLKAQSVSQF
jgi:hypothetical protein